MNVLLHVSQRCIFRYPKGDSKSNNLKTKIMRDLILNFIRESGVISFNDIIYALDLQTERQEAEMQIAFLQIEGFITYIQGKGYKAR